MIADDMKDELRQLPDDCLQAIIGYCEGLLDCRQQQDDSEESSE